MLLKHIQSKENLTRQVYLRSKANERKCFNLKGHKILMLVKPLYSVRLRRLLELHNECTPDTGLGNDMKLLWPFSLSEIHCQQSNWNTWKLCRRKFKCRKSRIAKSLQSQSRDIWVQAARLRQIFFFGAQIATKENKELFLNQPKYARTLKKISQDLGNSRFRQTRSLLSWLCHSRLEYTWIANEVSQVFEKTFSAADISDLSKVIKSVK